MADKPVDKNRLSFKDFHTTEYRPGEDEHTNYRAYRRKRTNESFGAAAAGGAAAAVNYLDKNRDDEDRRRRDDEERRKKRDSETTKKTSKPAKQKKQYRYLLHISDRPFTKAQKREAEAHHKKWKADYAKRKAAKAAAEKEKERLANRPMHQKAIDAVKGKLGKMFGKKEESEYSLDDIMDILERRGYKAQSFSSKRKAALRMKVGKTKHKARLGKRKAMRRMASQAVLKRRSRRQEWRNAFKKLSRGKKKSDMSIAQIQSIEKKLERPVWQRIVNRKQVIGVKDKRRLEIARKKGSWKK